MIRSGTIVTRQKDPPDASASGRVFSFRDLQGRASFKTRQGAISI
jgi:hypothetical protein